jgi:hypothetical protein
MATPNAQAQDGWFVAVDGKSYGPYTEEQIANFAAEGRVTASAPVMRTGEPWSLAGEHTSLAWIFAARPAVAAPQTAAAPTGAAEAKQEEMLAKVVIVADLRSGSTMAFEAAVAKLGRSYRMNQFVWLVHSATPIAQMRKDLLAHVGRNDPLFIADTTHGRASWLNFGPGAEATIKALWRGGL